MHIYQYILIVIILSWVAFITYYVNFTFAKKHAYMKKPEVEINSEYPAFTRRDYRRWNFFEMTLVGIFLFPFRLILVVLTIIWMGVCAKLLGLLCCVRDYEAELSPTFKYLSAQNCSWCSWWIMVFLGFLPAKRVSINYKDHNVKLKGFPDAKIAINISNHVSFIDSFFFVSQQGKSFIMKSGIRKMLTMGWTAESMQCLFIERDRKDSRGDLLNKLETRVLNIQNGLRFHPLQMYPEGTTSNGRGIADFKKGAFATKTPVKVWGLKYTSKFHPMNNLITTKDCLIGVCLQLYNTIKVFEIIEPIGPADETITADEFAKETKLLMCQLFDLEDFEAKFEDKKNFEQLICGFPDSMYK